VEAALVEESMQAHVSSNVSMISASVSRRASVCPHVNIKSARKTVNVRSMSARRNVLLAVANE
jgi:hypothetical protein